MRIVRQTALSCVALGTLAAFALASGDGGSSSSAPAAPADGFVAVPKLSELQMKVPEGAKPNRGAAGFHSEDKNLSLMIRELKDTSKTFDSAKASTEEFLFEGWIDTEETPQGWTLTYETVSMDMKGDKSPAYAFTVMRIIDNKRWNCTGSVPAKEALDANVEACQTLRAAL